jgi:hypothetical protein
MTMLRSTDNSETRSNIKAYNAQLDYNTKLLIINKPNIFDLT